MRITFDTRKFGNVERNSHCDVLYIAPVRVANLVLDCNGVLAIKACCAQPGQTGLFTQSCCDLVVPWPHTGVSFQVLLPAGGIM